MTQENRDRSTGDRGLQHLDDRIAQIAARQQLLQGIGGVADDRIAEDGRLRGEVCGPDGKSIESRSAMCQASDSSDNAEGVTP